MMCFTCTCKKLSYIHNMKKREERLSSSFSHFLFSVHVCVCVCVFMLFCEIDIGVSAMTAHTYRTSACTHRKICCIFFFSLVLFFFSYFFFPPFLSLSLSLPLLPFTPPQLQQKQQHNYFL